MSELAKPADISNLNWEPYLPCQMTAQLPKSHEKNLYSPPP